MILGEDGQKMSKSRGNVINPDDVIKDFGADAMRVYEMFMGPLEVSKPWITSGIAGVSRFLERLYAMSEKTVSDEEGSKELVRLLHKTLKKVTDDTSSLNFNTAISAMMVYSDKLNKLETLPRALWEPMVKMVSPYAPHLAEELWEKLGHKESISKSDWPIYDEQLTKDDEVTIVVQVNGKIRDSFVVPSGTSKEEIEAGGIALPGIQKWIEGKEIVKVITVPGKLVNIVVKG
jgi:leucyl-tRNA synthetase